GRLSLGPRAWAPRPAGRRFRPAGLGLFQPRLGRRGRIAPPGRALPPAHRRRYRRPRSAGDRACQPPVGVHRQPRSRDAGEIAGVVGGEVTWLGATPSPFLSPMQNGGEEIFWG